MRVLFHTKILVGIIALTLSCTYLAQATEASESEDSVISREEWKADDDILAFEENYSFPNKLILIPIPTVTTSQDSLESLRDLYYYFATRSGIGDLPFHYIVTWDGQVYFGNKLGEEARINLGGSESSIFIGYLPDDNLELTVSSVGNLKTIILNVINKFAINPENVSVKNLEYTLGEKGKIEEVTLSEANEDWQANVNLIKESLTAEYSPQDIVFNAELLEVTIPEEEQEVTKTTEIKVKIKNTGEFNLYSGPTSNIFVTRREPFDEASKFHLDEEWASPSRVGLLEEGERFEIGNEKEGSFKIYVPLYPPELSEDFILVGPTGDIIEGSEFTLTLKIKKPEQQILEITETEVGYLNVRSSPGLGEVITRVIPGERFLVHDYQSGYYKIIVDEGEGWVVNMYVRVVSS